MKKLIFILSFLSFFLTSKAQPINKQLIGKWEGKGKIIVTWCDLDSLKYSLLIHEDNSITGKIGDAIVYNAVVEKRSPIMTALGNGEYIIEGKLKGNIIEDEKIFRDGFIFMFSLKENKLVGGFHSSGWKIGGKEKMKLTVTDISLKKK
jgi:hypothetical protein